MGYRESRNVPNFLQIETAVIGVHTFNARARTRTHTHCLCVSHAARKILQRERQYDYYITYDKIGYGRKTQQIDLLRVFGNVFASSPFLLLCTHTQTLFVPLSPSLPPSVCVCLCASSFVVTCVFYFGVFLQNSPLPPSQNESRCLFQFLRSTLH